MAFSPFVTLCLIVAPAGGQAAGLADNDRSTPRLARTFVLTGVRGRTDTTGIPGRIDHLAYDTATHRLFVAALANNSLEVIDLDQGRRIRSIGGLPKPQGIAVVPTTGCAVVACGGDGTAHAFDTRTLEEKASAPVGTNADNVRYDAPADAVYVGCGDEKGGALAVLDARTLKKLRDIPLNSQPESFQLDPTGTNLFANLPGPKRANTNGSVVIIDRSTGKRVQTVTLENLARHFPLAYDRAHDRIFIACRRPAKLISLDVRSRRVIDQVDCVGDSDDLFYDHRSGRVLVIGGGHRSDDHTEQSEGSPAEDGAIDVFTTSTIGRLKKVGSIQTVRHARTGLFVEDRRAIYLAVSPRQGRDAEIHEYTIAHWDPPQMR